jgi:hypothetical protein
MSKVYINDTKLVENKHDYLNPYESKGLYHRYNDTNDLINILTRYVYYYSQPDDFSSRMEIFISNENNDNFKTFPIGIQNWINVIKEESNNYRYRGEYYNDESPPQTIIRRIDNTNDFYVSVENFIYGGNEGRERRTIILNYPEIQELLGYVIFNGYKIVDINGEDLVEM